MDELMFQTIKRLTKQIEDFLKACKSAGGTLPVHLLEAFQEAKNLREEADYFNRWFKQGCEKLFKLAGELLSKAKEIIT